MTKQEIPILITDYLANTISKEDHHRLMDAIEASNHDAELYAFMEKIWDSQPVEQSFSALQSALLYQQIIADSRFKAEPKKTGTRKLVYSLMGAAAALIIVASITLLKYNNREKTAEQKTDLAAAAIAPGSNKAVLTLANGKKIVLTDLENGLVLEQNGIKITKTKDGQLVYDASAADAGSTTETPAYNTVQTPLGGQYKIILPDGTHVWLNANSSLKYPASFDLAADREVSLTGEGYFEVAHNKQKPFFVNTNGQRLKVLGTHFNVNAYADEPQTVTTLIEGSVAVTANEEQQILKPGEQTLLDQDGLSVGQADIEAALAWKNGYFILKDEELGSIMRKIARWYNVEVVFTQESLKKKTLGGATPRSENLDEVIRKFELTGNIHFKVAGRRITVMP
ncbi:FecR family protein [Pedobacter insulae]|uniref:FecR protein n=1 Tax=Pedobacter insulae TaxID=414048 RepID=A0A1I2TAV1_9SPHI|nr:FecR domain-containing protein [Pedobacter insulae]SFG61985.1 FecR protein [Pedobacter insulae]